MRCYFEEVIIGRATLTLLSTEELFKNLIQLGRYCTHLQFPLFLYYPGPSIKNANRAKRRFQVSCSHEFTKDLSTSASLFSPFLSLSITSQALLPFLLLAILT